MKKIKNQLAFILVIMLGFTLLNLDINKKIEASNEPPIEVDEGNISTINKDLINLSVNGIHIGKTAEELFRAEELNNKKTSYPLINDSIRYDFSYNSTEKSLSGERKIKATLLADMPAIWNEAVLKEKYGEAISISDDKKSVYYTFDSLEDGKNTELKIEFYATTTIDKANQLIKPEFKLIDNNTNTEIKSVKADDVVTFGTMEDFYSREKITITQRGIQTRSVAIAPFAADNPIVTVVPKISDTTLTPLSGADFFTTLSYAISQGSALPGTKVQGLVMEYIIPTNIAVTLAPQSTVDYTVTSSTLPTGEIKYVISFINDMDIGVSDSLTFTLKFKNGVNPDVWADGTVNKYIPEATIYAANADSYLGTSPNAAEVKNTGTLSFAKTADTTYSILGETVRYTMDVGSEPSIGGLNIPSGQYIIEDTLPKGAIIKSVSPSTNFTATTIDNADGTQTVRFVSKADIIVGQTYPDKNYISVEYPNDGTFASGQTVKNTANATAIEYGSEREVKVSNSADVIMSARVYKNTKMSKYGSKSQSTIGATESFRILTNSAKSQGSAYGASKVTIIDDGENPPTGSGLAYDPDFYNDFRISSITTANYDYGTSFPFDPSKMSTNFMYKTNLKNTWTQAPGYPKMGYYNSIVTSVSSFGLGTGEFVKQIKFEKMYDDGNTNFPIDMEIYRNSSFYINGQILGNGSVGGANKIRNMATLYEQYVDDSGTTIYSSPKDENDTANVISTRYDYADIAITTPRPSRELKKAGNEAAYYAENSTATASFRIYNNNVSATGSYINGKQFILVPMNCKITGVNTTAVASFGQPLRVIDTDYDNLRTVKYLGNDYQVIETYDDGVLLPSSSLSYQSINVGLKFVGPLSSGLTVYRFSKSDNHSYPTGYASSGTGTGITFPADSLDFDGNGDTSETLMADNLYYKTLSTLTLSGDKNIKKTTGVWDWYGIKKPSDSFSYKIDVENKSLSVSTDKTRIIDILPYVGDTTIIGATPRNTEFDGVTIDTITGPGGAALSSNTKVYSTTTLDEVNAEKELSDLSTDYVTWQDGIVAGAKMIKIETTDPIATGAKVTYELNGTVPSTATNQTKAWNTFAFASTYNNGVFAATSAPSESKKVAMLIYDNTPRKISGQVFDDINKDGLKNDGTNFIENAEVQLYDSLGNLLKIEYTDADGKYFFDDLYPDAYVIKIKNPKSNYAITDLNVGSDKKIDNDFAQETAPSNSIAIASANLTSASDIEDLDLGIYLAEAKVEITKKDNKNNLLAGVKFGIYESDGTTLIEEITTDASGIATMTKALLQGSYVYKENNTLPGYQANTIPVSFTITGKEVNSIYKVTVINLLDIGAVEIEKADSADAAIKLSGAVFEIKNDVGTVVDTITTNASGIATSTVDLAPGNYTAVEKTAPTDYQLDTTPHSFTIVDGATTAVKLPITNVKSIRGVIVTKVDSVDATKKLAGAVFEIKNSLGTVVDTITTDATGVASSVMNLPSGTYTVKEKTPPSGYQLNPTAQTFTIIGSEAAAYTLTFANTLAVGAVKITKTDSVDSNIKLSGAVFEILDSLGAVVQTVTTDGTGVATTTGTLAPGTYTVKEKTAPTGYQLNPATQTFTLVGNEAAAISLTFIDMLDVGAIELTKVDSVDATKKLAGAVFEIKNAAGTVVDTITTDASGIAKSIVDLTPGNYTAVEKTAPTGYQLDATPIAFTIVEGASTAIKQTVTNKLDIGIFELTKVDSVDATKKLAGAVFEIKNSTGTVVDTISTDASGIATTIDLAPGNYTAVEKTAPTGYQLDATPIPFTIVEGATAKVSQTITNKQDIGAIEITKEDSADSTKKLSGAVFEVKNSTGTVVDTITTDASGIAKSTVDLAPGNYTAVEKTAPTGYQLDTTPIAFTIVDGASTAIKLTVKNYKDVGDLILTKEDSVTGTKLSGAVFEIKNAAGTVVDTITTDSTGTAKTTVDLAPGSYTAVEKTAPTGYQLDTTPLAFTIVDGASVAVKITATDKKDIGIFEITKVDSADATKKLAGAVFEIKDSAGTVVDTITTDASGIGTTKDLDQGNYTAIEKTAPTGYQLDTTPVAFTIVDGATTAVLKTITNKQDIGALELAKVDSVDASKKLFGAVFEVKDSTGNLIETITTDASGIGKSTVDLTPGTYTAVEITAPSGYQLDSTALTFTVVEGASAAETLTAKNLKDVGAVEITKKSGIDGSLLMGATFQVKNSSGAVVDTFTTDNVGVGKSTVDLAPGNYTLVETVAPAGYTVDPAPKTFTIVEGASSSIKLVIINEKTGLTIIKKDIENNFIPGAIFEIKNSLGVVIENVTTGINGIGRTNGSYPDGSYTATEIQAPVGYLLDSKPHSFIINFATQKVAVLTIMNDKDTPSIKVIKHDENGVWLTGAEFDVLDSSGVVVDHLITKVAGEATTSSALNFERYTLVETKAPNGYVLDTTPIVVDITQGNGAVTVDVVNKKSGNPVETGELVINKTGDAGVLLEGAEFEVKDSTGAVVANLKTDANGIATAKLPVGDYKVKETKAPNGYALSTAVRNVKITAAGEVVNLPITNILLGNGTLEITKKDDGGNVLLGAEFKVEDSTGLIVGNITTDANGFGSLKLIEGNYVVTETLAPSGYLIDISPRNITITANAATKLEVINIKGVNPGTNGTLSITKLNEDGDPLQGAEFEITNSTGAIVGNIVTDASGLGIISLPKGNYGVKETKAPIGYVLNSVVRMIAIEGYAGEVVQLNVLNTKEEVINNYEGRIRITNENMQGEVLPGSVFEIRAAVGKIVGADTNGMVVDTVTTDANGIAISKVLVPGTYTVHQKSINKPYKLNTNAFFATIVGNSSNEIVDVKVLNDKIKDGTIDISVVDPDGNPVPGAVVEIRDPDGNVIEKVTTGPDGTATVTVPEGNYEVVEVSAPDGYTLDPTPKEITVVPGESLEVVIVNPKVVPGEIVIKVVDPDGNPVPGAVVEIRDPSGKVVETVTTGPDGTAKVTVPKGEYEVVEISVPGGYNIDKTPKHVTIEGKPGESKEVIIVNGKTPTNPGTIEIIAVDPDGNPVPGAVVEIRDPDGNLIATVTTDQSGKATAAIPKGEYTATQISVPEGYVLDKTPKKLIVGSGKVTTVKFVNQKEKTSKLPRLPQTGSTLPINILLEIGILLAATGLSLLKKKTK